MKNLKLVEPEITDLKKWKINLMGNQSVLKKMVKKAEGNVSYSPSISYFLTKNDK